MVMGVEAAGAPNSACAASGKKCPKSEGPSTSPARISPTTPGCPSLLRIVLPMRAAAIITMSCSKTENSRSSV
jgi:hypothetical protein